MHGELLGYVAVAIAGGKAKARNRVRITFVVVSGVCGSTSAAIAQGGPNAPLTFAFPTRSTRATL